MALKTAAAALVETPGGAAPRLLSKEQGRPTKRCS
jgi:hypothetical protein